MTQTLLQLHFASAWTMVGLIWVIQLIVYPFFSRFDRNTFSAHHAEYVRRIGWIVSPVMCLEMLTAALLLKSDPGDLFYLLNVAGVVFAWGATGFLHVPQHRALQKGFDAGVHYQLVATNWIRTAIWTLRGISLIVFICA